MATTVNIMRQNIDLVEKEEAAIVQSLGQEIKTVSEAKTLIFDLEVLEEELKKKVGELDKAEKEHKGVDTRAKISQKINKILEEFRANMSKLKIIVDKIENIAEHERGSFSEKLLAFERRMSKLMRESEGRASKVAYTGGFAR